MICIERFARRMMGPGPDPSQPLELKRGRLWAWRGYLIEHDPPPIPVRAFDYAWWHADFDGAPNEVGEGPADDRHGHSATLELAKAAIDDQIEEDEG
ncbi:MAG TPA: hypothetical protein VM285_05700 [Polyangia bacterium]|nr:hypothetical protein [Polyangia bacterium]